METFRNGPENKIAPLWSKAGHSSTWPRTVRIQKNGGFPVASWLHPLQSLEFRTHFGICYSRYMELHPLVTLHQIWYWDDAHPSGSSVVQTTRSSMHSQFDRKTNRYSEICSNCPKHASNKLSIKQTVLLLCLKLRSFNESPLTTPTIAALESSRLGTMTLSTGTIFQLQLLGRFCSAPSSPALKCEVFCPIFPLSFEADRVLQCFALTFLWNIIA